MAEEILDQKEESPNGGWSFGDTTDLSAAKEGGDSSLATTDWSFTPPEAQEQKPEEPKKPEGGFVNAFVQPLGPAVSGVGQAVEDMPQAKKYPTLQRFAKGAKEWGKEFSEEHAPSITSFEEAKKEPLKFVEESVGGMGGQAAAAFGTGVLGRAVGAGIGGILGGPAGAVVGGAALGYLAANAPMMSQEYGQVRERQDEKGTKSIPKAVADMLLNTAIENWGGVKPGALAAPGKMVAEIAEGLAGKSVKEGAKTILKKGVVSGLGEAGEELLQNPIQAIAVGDDPLSKKEVQNALFSAASAFPGGMLFGSGEMLGKYNDQRNKIADIKKFDPNASDNLGDLKLAAEHGQTLLNEKAFGDADTTWLSDKVATAQKRYEEQSGRQLAAFDSFEPTPDAGMANLVTASLYGSGLLRSGAVPKENRAGAVAKIKAIKDGMRQSFAKFDPAASDNAGELLAATTIGNDLIKEKAFGKNYAEAKKKVEYSGAKFDAIQKQRNAAVEAKKAAVEAAKKAAVEAPPAKPVLTGAAETATKLGAQPNVETIAETIATPTLEETAKKETPKAEAKAPAAKVEKPPTIKTTVDLGAHNAATSPLNDIAEPTPEQAEQGAYKKGDVTVSGLPMAIENPEGSERKGADASGKQWSTTMKDHYGYIKGVQGADKDHIDAFIKPGTPENYNGEVFVVDQKHPDNGRFDEHKIMLGYGNKAEAEAAYRRNYSPGWDGIQHITPMQMPQFKDWLANGDTTKPITEKDATLSKWVSGEKLNPVERAELIKQVESSKTSAKKLERVYSEDPGYSVGEIVNLGLASFTSVDLSLGKNAGHITFKWGDEALGLVEKPIKGLDVDYKKTVTRVSPSEEQETILSGKYRVTGINRINEPGSIGEGHKQINQYVFEEIKQEPKNAIEKQSTAATNEGGRTQPAIRREGGDTAVGGEGLRESGHETIAEGGKVNVQSTNPTPPVATPQEKPQAKEVVRNLDFTLRREMPEGKKGFYTLRHTEGANSGELSPEKGTTLSSKMIEHFKGGIPTDIISNIIRPAIVSVDKDGKVSGVIRKGEIETVSPKASIEEGTAGEKKLAEIKKIPQDVLAKAKVNGTSAKELLDKIGTYESLYDDLVQCYRK